LRAIAIAMHTGATLCAAQSSVPPSAPASADHALPLRRAQQQVFHAALEAAAPGIVRIDTIGGAQPAGPSAQPGGEPAAPGFRPADGPTTGLICSADGYILSSSFNFLRDPAVITVKLADGRRFVAKLVARDGPAGLTLLKIDATGLPVPHWAPRRELRPGQWALVTGYGHGGDTPALSVGILSAVDRLEGRAVQTDAKTSPVNYGGPLLDIEARVMGICVPKAGSATDELAGVEWYDSGIGFAIHADYIQDRLPRLKAGTNLQRGFMGVAFDSLAPVVDPSSSAQAPNGVVLTAVPPGPAADAGLQPGDVITNVNGRPTPQRIDIRRELARLAAGDQITVTYRRGEQTATATLTLVPAEALRPSPTSPPTSQPASAPASQPDTQPATP
jgi:serine protease Do